MKRSAVALQALSEFVEVIEKHALTEAELNFVLDAMDEARQLNKAVPTPTVAVTPLVK